MASTASKFVTASPASDAMLRCVAVPSAKLWGRRDLGRWGDGAPVELIGEIHHRLDGVSDPELLVKTLFTGERLSIQVHPDAAAAAARGYSRGKDEAWVVLDAEPGATIGLGLKSAVDAESLRLAALDGSIVELLIWHPCKPGDVFLTPAGTIHAIGAGVTLFEVQQNLDLTYRLHDYGRPRELHLDEGLAVANLAAWQPLPPPAALAPGRELLVAGPGFVLERLHTGAGVIAPAADRPLWIAVIAGEPRLGQAVARAGEVWHAETPLAVAGGAELLLAYPGATPVANLWTPS
jgi:mannose-6-phosphate isomerase